MFNVKQEGLPYNGWTIPQFYYWIKVGNRHEELKDARSIENLTFAIDGAMSKEGRKKLIKLLRKTNAK